MKSRLFTCAIVTFTVSLSGAEPEQSEQRTDPFPSTYKVRSAPDTLIQHVTLLTGTGKELQDASILISQGRIVAFGKAGSLDAEAVRGAQRIDGTGKWLTPGIIDVHSHIGDYAAPAVPSLSDGNEATEPNTAHVWAEHSVWPQDPQFSLALAGGITTAQILPGSANLFGGRGVTLKNVPSRTTQGMKFPDAPYSLKMACGENPKRVYGGRDRAPSTRMGNVAGYRAAWIDAADYLEKQAGDEPPKRDLKLETLAGVLKGEILVHNHCYRADEMATMIDIAKEFGYKITAFHHAIEAYKVADLLAAEGICSAMWADWWGFKLEAFDGIQQDVALVDKAGACAIVHSDSSIGIQRLNQEAAKAMAAGRRVGMQIRDADAIGWITSNAAKALGIFAETGSIETGKAADLVLWNVNPFSVYSRADLVFIDGYIYFDRSDTSKQPVSDFELKQTPRGGAE